MKFPVCLIACLFITGAFTQDNRDILQSILNGLFENAGLQDPTTVLDCFDDASVDLTVNFISDSLQKISDGDFFGLLGTLTTFQSSLPQDVQEALMQNGEIQELFAQYGATNFDLETIATEIGGYGFDHLDVLNSDGISADNSYNSGDYNGVGQEAGVILQAALSGN